MIDIRNETILRLQDARKLRWLRGRKAGGQLDIGTLRRWAQRGIQGTVLETVKIGATTFTSEQACLRFIRRLNAPTTIPDHPSRRHEVVAINKRLEDAGII